MQVDNYQKNYTNFKSTFPVQHWVAEGAGGSYAPVANNKIVKKMQGKLVRILNKPLSETTKKMNPVEQRLRAYLGINDADYRKNSRVRSFYNRDNSDVGNYSPISYILSGKDVDIFEEKFAKDIGREKSNSKEQFSTPYSQSAKQAIDTYNSDGLEYINNIARRLRNQKTGMTYVLHTKFEIIRDKFGKIKDYKFVDARFMPEFGSGNPFVRLGLVKQ